MTDDVSPIKLGGHGFIERLICILHTPRGFFLELTCALQEAGGYGRGAAFGNLSSSRRTHVGGSYVSSAGTLTLVAEEEFG